MAATRTLYGSSRFASSSSSTQPRWSYDVFLSFRGEDTRKNFTDHLYTALVQAGIHTFVDDDELPRGHDISSALLKSIEESRISIVVFSTHYASSRWCLDELVKIIESKKTLGQLVLPLFYDVDPSNVQHQTECSEKHLEDMKSVTWMRWGRWRIDSHVEHINLTLSIGSDDVRMIGIYSLGEIGKTTIAKAVYNHIFLQFKGSCFLANVREVAGKLNGLVQLQEQLLFELLGTKNLKIGSVDKGINLMKEGLHSKKVLIVLDDADQSSQLNTLAGNRDWFGPGSRIIITTTDEHLLKGLKVDERYMPKELNHEESLQLFSWHAFRETNPLENFAELANDIVSYARGLPLALEILGSYLFGRNILEWKTALDELQQIPHHQIQKKT
ncbi:TMV resistance protein N-like [Camellia sinensis]|uniref:TMV resistance protein N-like n=1 Tax=Camellia sinensis TaxID=4442 RepID=UPI001035CA61|nr:TMV resistance protein N-like [Camellia sinensis]